jgi:hypothetical protein
MTQPLVFISYSQKDEPEKEQLLVHLAVLQQAGRLELWSEERIGPGLVTEQAIETAINQARVAVLLITANFLSSEAMTKQIIPKLQARQAQSDLVILPVLARHCAWSGVGWLNSLDIRPRHRRPVWGEAALDAVNQALADLALEVEALVNPQPAHSEPGAVLSNPFFSGGRINDPTYFFGRERLLRELRAELKKRSSISLVGPSEIGKSSLLYYLYATRAEWLPEVTMAYIDLQGVLDEEDFCETVLEKLEESGNTLRHLKRTLSQREVVLLLDEVERLAEPDFNPRLHDLLRSQAQEPQLAMLLATRRHLLDVFPSWTPGGVSPFYNIFATKIIGPFSDTEARLFLSSRLTLTGLTFSEAEIEQLLAQSQGHPAQLQRLAKALFAEKAGIFGE